MYISQGLITAIIVGGIFWGIVAFIEERLQARRENKEADRHREEFNKHHHYDDDRQRWVRNVDGAALYEYGYGPATLRKD
jgi:hypothetical protein